MKTNNLLALILVFSIFSVFAEETEKKYTQKELDKIVQEKVEKQIKRIKKSSIAKLTSEILEKEMSVESRQKSLDKRLEQVKMAESSLASKIVEFEKTQSKVLGCIAENKDKAKKRVNGLVSMISNMKPLKAADVLSVQDSKISIQILENIDPVKASKIFNLMDKEVSARLQKQYLNMRR